MFNGLSLMSIVIGTAIVNVIPFIVARPVAKLWFSRLLARIQKANDCDLVSDGFLFGSVLENFKIMPQSQAKGAITELRRTCFGLVVTSTSAIAGFCFGLLGFGFVAIPVRPIALPAAVVFSLAGAIAWGIKRAVLLAQM